MSSEKTGSSPATSAERRVIEARRPRMVSRTSEKLAAAVVSSMRSKTWPASTSSPPRTMISETMPPSRFWTICT